MPAVHRFKAHACHEHFCFLEYAVYMHPVSHMYPIDRYACKDMLFYIDVLALQCCAKLQSQPIQETYHWPLKTKMWMWKRKKDSMICNGTTLSWQTTLEIGAAAAAALVSVKGNQALL